MSNGPSWEDVQEWCRRQGAPWELTRDQLVRYGAEREVQRTLAEMRRLAATIKESPADWITYDRAWKANYAAHNRALAIAFPEKQGPR